MSSSRAKTSALMALLCAGALSLALAGGAGSAIVTIYTNGFKSKAQYQEVKRSGGGSKCGRGYRDRTNMMRITTVGKRLCRFSPPFFGDEARPDHVITAVGQILPQQTPKRLRKSAYLAVVLRLGGAKRYELQVRPRGKRFKLTRNPASAGVSEQGKSDAIKKLRQMNKLHLEVKGARVIAKVNGKTVATAVDPSPDDLNGRKVGFGLGNRRDSSRGVAALYKRIRAGLKE